MKVVKAKEMMRIEKLAYARGASEEAFMNEAGRGIAVATLDFIKSKGLAPKVTLLCGSGNNAGDAYVAAMILKKQKVDVMVFALAPLEKSSPLCQLQAKRYRKRRGKIQFIQNEDEVSFLRGGVIIDGILGTGFHGQVEGLFASVIEKAHRSHLPILSIDIPSGIDGNTGEIGGIAIKAKETVFLGLPKAGCFIGDAWNHVGRNYVFDFGLSEEFIEQAEEDFIALTDKLVGLMMPLIEWNRHKYQAGYVVGLGGSFGMPGAPTMASFAALKSGAGIVKLLHPKGMELELTSAPFEIVKIPYTPDQIDMILDKINQANSCFIGPGLGTAPDAVKVLESILPWIQCPLVIDAEALTLLSNLDIYIPHNAVLTPHHGEMKRLLHITEKNVDLFHFFNLCQEFVEERNVTLVLKGAPTVIFHPACARFLCTRGNPGMATAGSGDVLTGMIASFLSQGCPVIDAACLGVYLHGMGGEFAAEKLTPYCMVATDILRHLPEVFNHFIFKVIPDLELEPELLELDDDDEYTNK